MNEAREVTENPQLYHVKMAALIIKSLSLYWLR